MPFGIVSLCRRNPFGYSGNIVFDLVSDYAPAGDQPQAIAKLTDGVLAGAKHRVLLGVTDSGKTFTVVAPPTHLQPSRRMGIVGP
jgi:hypothetical protein